MVSVREGPIPGSDPRLTMRDGHDLLLCALVTVRVHWTRVSQYLGRGRVRVRVGLGFGLGL